MLRTAEIRCILIPPRHWAGLDDRSPEQNASAEKARKFDFMPPRGPHSSSNRAGVCHAITVAAPANQQNTGGVTKCPNVCTGEQRNNGPENEAPERFRQ